MASGRSPTSSVRSNLLTGSIAPHTQRGEHDEPEHAESQVCMENQIVSHGVSLPSAIEGRYITLLPARQLSVRYRDTTCGLGVCREPLSFGQETALCSLLQGATEISLDGRHVQAYGGEPTHMPVTCYP